MLTMDSYRGAFEMEWQKAFEGAEIAPSGNVWTQVESSLVSGDNQNLKRGLFFFKLLAAASVAFAITIGFLGYYDVIGPQPQITEQTPVASEPDEEESTAEESATEQIADESASDQITEEPAGEETPSLTDDESTNPVTSPSKDSGQLAVTTVPEEQESIGTLDEESVFTENRMQLTSLDRKALEFESLPMVEPEFPYFQPTQKFLFELEEDDPDALWAGLDMGAGNFGGISLGAAGDENAVMDEAFLGGGSGDPTSLQAFEDEERGTTFQLGFGVGKRLSKRFIASTGLYYGYQNSTVRTNRFVDMNSGPVPVYRNDALEASPDLSFTQIYQLNNSVEYLSIPVQAGYVVVDRKISWIISTGVGTDMVIGNTLSDEQGVYQRQSLSPGNDSPYRRFYYNALLSSELMFKIGRHYGFSVVPHYRRSLHSDATFNFNMPSSWGMGFRFQYIFE